MASFEHLLETSSRIAGDYPDDAVFIGGLAIYLHAINSESMKDMAESTHDGDLFISLTGFGFMRAEESLTSNAALRKHQLIRSGHAFDVYVHRGDSLRIDYPDIYADAVNYGEFKVACLEHLLALKLIAYRDRQGSEKGQKDARDIARICKILGEQGGFRPEKLDCLYDDELADLDFIAKNSAAATTIAKGNLKIASPIRQSVMGIVAQAKQFRRTQQEGSEPAITGKKKRLC